MAGLREVAALNLFILAGLLLIAVPVSVALRELNAFVVPLDPLGAYALALFATPLCFITYYLMFSYALIAAVAMVKRRRGR